MPKAARNAAESMFPAPKHPSQSFSAPQVTVTAAAPTAVLHPELMTAGEPGNQGTGFRPETNLQALQTKQTWIKELTLSYHYCPTTKAGT